MPKLIAVDSETHLIQPGLLTPPGVCGSFSTGAESWVELFPGYLDTLEGALKPGTTLAVANGAFDFGVAVAPVKGGRWTGRPELLKLIFAKHERGEVFDILIAMALDAVAGGHLFKDPVTGGPLRMPADPVTGKAGKLSYRYSLAMTLYLLTGEVGAKDNADFVLRYHEFENMPIEAWPEKARVYPADDARNTYRCAEILAAKGRNLGKLERHAWTHLTHQTRAAWAMHLMSAWGLRTDGGRVAALAARVDGEHAKTLDTFKASGLISEDGKNNGAEIKRRVILAYSMGVAVGSEAAAVASDAAGGLPNCPDCKGTGKTHRAKVSEKTGKPLKGSTINCVTCSSAGIAIPPSVPRTPAGGVKTDRDTLSESGDDLLEAFADAGENDKLRDTYLPFLRQGVEIPINVRGNVLVDTGRASFEGLIQLLPKRGGVRECFRARPGYVYCSVDYNALELATLAQVCLWTLGHSRMAESINAGKDLHSILGAQMVGCSEAHFLEQVKAKRASYVNYRFAAKAGNFGFGGLMGAAKFALTQRKAKGFPGADGSKHGSMCRLGGVETVPCGTVKITEWKGRECPPVCGACVDFSETLRKSWLNTWEEMGDYFKEIAKVPGIRDGAGTMISPGTGYVRGNLNMSAGANHPFQHLAAMGAKHALWNVSRECYTVESSPLYGSRPVVFAHDEIITELIEAKAHEAAYRQAEVMIASMREFVPDVKIAAEPALMRYWEKAATPAFDAAGRLIPWVPA